MKKGADNKKTLSNKEEIWQFNLAAMEVDSFFIYNVKSSKFVPQGINKDFKIGIAVEIKHSVFLELNIIQTQVISNVQIESIESREKFPLSDMTVSIDFKVKNLDQFVTNGKLVLPDRLAYTFTTVAFSTSRGILFEKLHTRFGQVILPLFDTSSYSHEDIIFELDKEKMKDHKN